MVEVVQVASNFLARSAWGSLEKWRGATLSEPFPLYNLDNRLSSYGFNVIGLNGLCGYIIVNTDKNDAPVPEFGDSPGLPFLKKYSELSANVGNFLVQGQELKETKVIYFSASTFLAEFIIRQEDNSQIPLIFDLQTGEILSAPPPKAIVSDAPSKTENQRAWALLKTSNSASSDSVFLERIISGVPAYYWFMGCSPTSGGMVMGYWQPRGYPNLPLGNSLIGELAIWMHTSPDGSTLLANIPGGIYQVGANHGYYFQSWNDGTGRPYSTIGEFMNEIQYSRPLLVTVSGSSTYCNHTMAGYGYRVDNGVYYIVVHDTWDSNAHYLDYNSSVVNNPTWTYVVPH
ncbi:MAG: hypothetical protein QMD88_07715 [Coprothermobacterota bacterium]|nr:hypothetical protein [Coprothermobacterota bacterium]